MQKARVKDFLKKRNRRRWCLMTKRPRWMLDRQFHRSCTLQGQSSDPIVQRSLTIGTMLILLLVVVIIVVDVKPLVMPHAYEIGGVVRHA
jgi:hypothetical protein